MPSTTNNNQTLSGGSQSVQLSSASLHSDPMSNNPTAGALATTHVAAFKTRDVPANTPLAGLVRVDGKHVGATFNEDKSAVFAAMKAVVLDKENLGVLRVAAYNFRCTDKQLIKALAELLAKTPDILECIVMAKVGKKQIVAGIRAVTEVSKETAKSKKDAAHVWPLPFEVAVALSKIELPDAHQSKSVLSSIGNLVKDKDLATYVEERLDMLSFANKAALPDVLTLNEAYNKIADSNKTEGIPPIAKTVAGKRKLENLENEVSELRKKAALVGPVMKLEDDVVVMSLNLADAKFVYDPNGNVIVTGRAPVVNEGDNEADEGVVDDDDEE